MGTYVTLPGDLTDFRRDLSLSDSNPATQPTLTQATGQLALYEAEAEAAAAFREYTVPLSSTTNPRSFKQVKLAVINAMAAYVLRNRGLGPDSETDVTSDAMICETYWRDFLAAVRGIPGYLIDATVGTGGDAQPGRVKFRSLVTEQTRDGGDVKDFQVFTRGMKV